MDLGYKNQNVRGRKAFKKGQSLILFTVRKVFEQFCATSYIVSVKLFLTIFYSIFFTAVSFCKTKFYLFLLVFVIRMAGRCLKEVLLVIFKELTEPISYVSKGVDWGRHKPRVI